MRLNERPYLAGISVLSISIDIVGDTDDLFYDAATKRIYSRSPAASA
jgi:hypothetical protein